MSAMSSTYTHSSQLARGIQIEWLSAGWMVIEALTALFAGIPAHSIALIAFGADSVIELVAGGALLFRLYVEANEGGSEHVERTERTASWIVGIALVALAAYILVSSAVSLFAVAPRSHSTGNRDCGGVEYPYAPHCRNEKKSGAAHRQQGARLGRGVQHGLCIYVLDTSWWRRRNLPARMVVGGFGRCSGVRLVRSA